MVLPRNSEIFAMLKKELNPVERLTDLFRSGDDRQDIMIMLLYEIAVLLSGQQEEPGNGQEFPTGLQVHVPISVTSDKLIDKVQALTTAVIPPTVMGDCRKALRMLVLVENGFDQAVTAEIIGNISNVSNAGQRVIATVNIAAGETAGYGIGDGEWYPWIGVQLTPAGNPTKGEVNASLVKQVQGEV